MSIRPSDYVCQCRSHSMDCPWNLIFRTFYEKLQIWLKSDKYTGTLYRPYFFKKGTTHKISVLQKNREGGATVQTTNALTGRISSTCLGYSWRCSCHLCTCYTGLLFEWFATHNSVQLKAAVSPLLQNRDHMEATLSCVPGEMNSP